MQDLFLLMAKAPTTLGLLGGRGWCRINHVVLTQRGSTCGFDITMRRIWWVFGFFPPPLWHYPTVYCQSQCGLTNDSYI